MVAIPNLVKNVTISGSGSIIGDKTIHTGISGEWGNCVTIGAANNVTIKGVTMKDAWGDGIYSTGCVNLSILGCTIDGDRRNGISFIAGSNITIKGNTIKNINGTAPKAAIDFEPNTRDQIIENAWISGNFISDCYIGVELVAARSWIKNAIIDNNVMSTTLSGETHAISLYGYKNPSGAEYPNEIKNCINIEVCRNRIEGFFRQITSGYGERLSVHDNTFILDKDISSMVSDTAQNVFYLCGNVDFKSNYYCSPLQLYFDNGGKTTIENNYIDTYKYRYSYSYGMGLAIHASSINNIVFHVSNNEIDGGLGFDYTGFIVGNKISHYIGDNIASWRGWNGTGTVIQDNSFYEDQDRPILAFYGSHVLLECNRFYGAEGRTSPYIRLMSASSYIKVGMTNQYLVSVTTPVSNEGSHNVVETA
jgi:hypothetical protein